VIDTPKKLDAYLPVLRRAAWVAVDTEADSLHAYPEKVCLLQASTPEGDDLIDPLAEIDLEPLFDELSHHELIMHGSDYDLRLFRKHHGFVPTAIFDTMLAARLLGHTQFGLGNLAERCLGVHLEKGPQKANWALRPLTERMEAYARNDTRHLKPLADGLRRDLDDKGRLDWHRECCERLIEECARERSPDPDLVWRLKGSHLLGRPALAVLRELWYWREDEAVAANRPPFFVVSHEILVDVAVAASTGHPLDPVLPRHLSGRRRAGLLAAVDHALGLPPADYPGFPRTISRRATEGERRRFVEIQKDRDARAAELGIDPTLIASRSALSDLAHDWDRYSLDLMSWQRRLLAC